MGFLAPFALLGLLAVPLIVAFYMLRLRRPQRTVSSTFLWTALVRDVEANAPWQRLRRSLLLLLQLLLAIALALIVARPFAERPAGLAHDLVLVVDASASMAAKDVHPNRLAAAKQAALDALRDLPSDGKVSVIAAAETARLVANEATDRGRIARAIEGIEQSSAAGDLSDALKLADKLADRARGAEIVVATDDALVKTPDVKLTAPVRTLLVGRDRHNQAIVALAVRPDPAGLKRSVFVGIANLDSERVVRRLRILADGIQVAARDVQLDALRRSEVISDELPAGAHVVEAQLVDPGAGTADAGAPDDLALDDSAWAVVPQDRVQKILLVGPGNVYLQNALSLLPNVELYGATPTEWATTTGKEKFDLFVFDGFLPPAAELPRKPTLAIAPPATSALGTVTGTLDSPAVGRLPADEPLLRNVDLTRLHVAKAQRLELPDWARPVIPGPGTAPLLYSGLRDGVPTAVLAFDLRQSDLPLQVAWPILVGNVTGELLGSNGRAADPIAPASPVDIPIPLDTDVVKVTRPDGTVVELTPAATGAASVTFVDTRSLGVYRADAIPRAVSAPSGSPGAASPYTSPSPSASGSAGADASGGLVFAVDLFDTDESNIAPGNGFRLAALGGPAASPGTATGTTRDEWWVPLVLLALLFLMIEWLAYERDGARRLANLVRGRRVAAPALSLRPAGAAAVSAGASSRVAASGSGRVRGAGGRARFRLPALPRPRVRRTGGTSRSAGRDAR